jgi:hypothetical protein
LHVRITICYALGPSTHPPIHSSNTHFDAFSDIHIWTHFDAFEKQLSKRW